jgi:hypothetical protein
MSPKVTQTNAETTQVELFINTKITKALGAQLHHTRPA